MKSAMTLWIFHMLSLWSAIITDWILRIYCDVHSSSYTGTVRGVILKTVKYLLKLTPSKQAFEYHAYFIVMHFEDPGRAALLYSQEKRALNRKNTSFFLIKKWGGCTCRQCSHWNSLRSWGGIWKQLRPSLALKAMVGLRESKWRKCKWTF